MPKKGSKPTKTTKNKKPLSTPKVDRGFLTFIQIKHLKRKHQHVITVSVPATWQRNRKITRNKKPSNAHVSFLKTALTDKLTLGLLIIGILGLLNIFKPVPTNHQSVSVIYHKTQTAKVDARTIGLTRSAPNRLEIPSIKVDAAIMEVGKKADGTIQVPKFVDTAGWYQYAPTPGEIGPAIIVGHVDSVKGPAIFFYLKAVQPGDLVRITRDDGQIVTFKVDKIELFAQDAFPTQAVYGNINYSGLRLITCGGDFNYVTRHYSHNVVVYATRVDK